jgi:hypothetical protein
MTRSDYTYEVRDYAGRNVIKIEDLDRGRVSVTNDIKNVVEEIAKKENLDARRYMIIYKDSEGRWDGWDHNLQDFVPIRSFNWKSAINIYIAKQLQSQ